MANQRQKDRLVKALNGLGGSAGNVRLRDALGWKEDTYTDVKNALIRDGIAIPGRGRGGSVALAEKDNGSSPKPKSETPSSTAQRTNSAQNVSSFEQAFRNIDDALRKEAGCTTELDYTEQTSWLLFLKYLDGLEEDKATEAELDGKKYAYILDKPYRWETWAAPKGKDGKLDHNKALTGDDLCDFVNQKLFPYLQGFTQKATGPDTIEYKIGQIFGEIKNKIQSGYNMREIIDHIDELRFRSQTEKHELSHLYEAKIRNMGNAGRNGGEYYTPRPSCPNIHLNLKSFFIPEVVMR